VDACSGELEKLDLYGIFLPVDLTCAYFCRGSGPEATCRLESDYQRCVDNAMKSYDRGDENLEEYAKAGFRARVDCCDKFLNADVGQCNLSRESRKKARNGEPVFDEYGDPVEGMLLSLLVEDWQTQTPTDSAGLSGGAVAAIVIGCRVGIGAIAGALVFFLVIRPKGDDGDGKVDA
jgi:hypothetical protein